MGSRGSVIPFFLNRAKEGILPITHKDMTRFNILLSEGVDMVLWAIENALGGEIFVPKIPSYKVVDVAEAIGPNCSLEEIGIRPGEKVHEEMITNSDSLSTIDMGDYYAILPNSLKSKNTYMKHFGATEVQYGFSYSSGSNPDFLSIEELRTLIKNNIDPNFKPI